MRVLRQEWFSGHIKAFFLGAVLAVFALVIGGSLAYYTTYHSRFYEGVFIDSVDVSRLTKAEALQKLQENTVVPSTTVTLQLDQTSLASSSAALGVHHEYDDTLETALQWGRSSTIINNIATIFSTYTQAKNFESPLAFDTELTTAFTKQYATLADHPGKNPSAHLENGKIIIDAGAFGQAVNIEQTNQAILSAANTSSPVITAVMKDTGIQLNPEQITAAVTRAQKLVGKTLKGKVDIVEVDIDDAQLVAALTFPEGYDDELISSITDEFKEKIDRPAKNAVFSFDPSSLKVSEFQPDLDGITINQQLAHDEVVKALKTFESDNAPKELVIEIPKTAKKAEITLGSLNNLGINERIGFGETYYYHSIPSRVHNVSQASKILNNTIVQPGEEFSFNKTLGEVSKSTGFLPAYIIQSGQTVLGDGGGVCQVSTTLFRSLLDSGLKITKRKAHSYRVSYYELNREPGFDATVFSGDVDLRFVNDSPGAVLLHFETFPDDRYMFVTIYGTNDGRTTEISEYKKWDSRGAPPAQYIDDPSLPPGKLVQIDFAVGGIKAQFKHTVRDKTGNLMYENVYYSNYIPWSAKYRRGV